MKIEVITKLDFNDEFFLEDGTIKKHKVDTIEIRKKKGSYGYIRYYCESAKLWFNEEEVLTPEEFFTKTFGDEYTVVKEEHDVQKKKDSK